VSGDGVTSGTPGGRAPGGGSGGEAPEADEVFFVFKTVLFNTSAAVLHCFELLLSCSGL